MYTWGLETAAQQVQRAPTAQKEIKSWQLVQLMAWSRQTNVHDVDPVWEKLAATTDVT